MRATVRGIAWFGNGPITDVEVDAGEGWWSARLSGLVDEDAAVSWTFDWAPQTAGRHALSVRATDAAGHRRPEPSVGKEGGYGNNVVQRISVEVEVAAI